jgi:membrane protease YdiL (CAAX protease family)
MKKVLIPGLVAGLVMLIVAMGFGILLNTLFPSLQAEYEDTELFRPWDDPLMSVYFIYPFVLGITLAWAWNKTKGLIKEKRPWKRGIHFALAFWLVATIPGMIITYSSFPVSLELTISWSISSLLQVVCAGVVYSKLNK